jgi:hypothetical protein
MDGISNPITVGNQFEMIDATVCAERSLLKGSLFFL